MDREDRVKRGVERRVSVGRRGEWNGEERVKRGVGKVRGIGMTRKGKER